MKTYSVDGNRITIKSVPNLNFVIVSHIDVPIYYSLPILIGID